MGLFDVENTDDAFEGAFADFFGGGIEGGSGSLGNDEFTFNLHTPIVNNSSRDVLSEAYGEDTASNNAGSFLGFLGKATDFASGGLDAYLDWQDTMIAKGIIDAESRPNNVSQYDTATGSVPIAQTTPTKSKVLLYGGIALAAVGTLLLLKKVL